jgi:hypothetical protein
MTLISIGSLYKEEDRDQRPKKRARSQARRAKKEAQNAASSSDSGNVAPNGSSCNHVKIPENLT